MNGLPLAPSVDKLPQLLLERVYGNLFNTLLQLYSLYYSVELLIIASQVY